MCLGLWKPGGKLNDEGLQVKSAREKPMRLISLHSICPAFPWWLPQGKGPRENLLFISNCTLLCYIVFQ